MKYSRFPDISLSNPFIEPVMIKIYTIGFTEKSAEQFFGLLTNHDVACITDTRVSNTGQLAGFAKGQDLAFFAKTIGNILYNHHLDLAPAKEMLVRYRAKEISWEEYESEYLNLIDMRRVKQRFPVESLHRHCLLCSEHGPERCHRRLLAEYLQAGRPDMEIVHLK